MSKGTKWSEIPEPIKIRMAASMKLRKKEAAYRRAERSKLGIGRRKSTLVRIPRRSLDRLRACAFARQALCTIRNEQPEFVSYRFSMSEELRRQIDLAFERFRRQLEYLGSNSTDARPELALEKMMRLDAGWK